MSLFGTFYSVEKEKPLSLKEMTTSRYSNKALVNALLDYLKGRKEQKNLPSRISWAKQLDLLDRMKTDEEKIKQVETATIRGWRQIAYDKPFDNKPVVRHNDDDKEKARAEMAERKEVY